MFLHLGRDVVVAQTDIVAILDMDTATATAATRAFLTEAERAGCVEVITDELPKSAVVCQTNGNDHIVYISQLSSKTLHGRARGPLPLL